MTISELKTNIKNKTQKSAWDKGVQKYAIEIVENFQECIGEINTIPSRNELEKELLNGARDWDEYSSGGCSFIYDSDIAERLCTPSELKRNRNGELNPNTQENWLDVQARALHQAANLIFRTIRSLQNET